MTPISGTDEWRKRLLEVVCYVAAAALLLVPVLSWLISGQKPVVFELPIVVGLLFLSLPFVDFLSLGTRSWLYCVGLILIVGAVALNFGFAPVFVGVYNLLLLTSGLLIGQRAMVVVSVVGVSGLILIGGAVDAGMLSIDMVGRDPGTIRNWVRVTVLFSILSLAVVAIVRLATRNVSDQYVRVQRELAQARRLREAAEDVRQRRLARERGLRGTQKLQAVAALSGGLAHLFNNALTVVQSVLESLRKNSSASSRERAMDRLGNALEPAVRATHDLMIFSRREAPEVESIELGPLLTDFADTVGQTVSDDVDLKISTAPGLNVLMHPESLKQLFLNLVLNAVDATGAPGIVRITVAPIRENEESEICWAAIVVEDDGPGMDEATLDQALDPFFTRKAKHSGLGLPVAHTIAAQAGGELRLESSAGVGTRVLVMLPLERPLTVDDVDQLWPTPSALHGDLRQGAADVPGAESDWTEDSVPEPAWQDDVTQRLGRIAATIIAVLALVVAVIVPHMRPTMSVIGPLSVGLLAVAGWATGVPSSIARASLIVGFWIIGAAVVFRAGFDNMAGMSIVLIAIAWAGLLGKRWDGLIAIAITAATFLVIAVLRSGPVSYPPASNSDMNVAANWFRFAPQLALYSLALSTSVLGALAAAREGADSEQEALERVELMRERESKEGARLLALEASGTRSARAAAAGQAAGVVAHDLLNAVQSLMGAVEVLSHDRERDDHIPELITGLAHAAGYAEALVTQFQSISPTKEAVDYYPVCDMSLLLDNMADLMRRVLPPRIELQADIEPELAARISETDFRRLLFNLISNARDAIEGSGTISISLRAQGDDIALCVSDTGCGIEDAVRERMFDAFFTTKERGSGTGLGLHSVDDVVSRTRGTIAVESTPGDGSSFTVTWPAEELQTRTLDASASASTALDGSGGTVLLAEDEPLVRQIMAETIRGAGFDVVEAADGDEGKRLALDGTDYVAACIDGVMPGAPSAEVIECFQKAHPGSPILLCSGYLPADLAERGLMRSGVTLLTKPFAPTRLQQELKEAISQSV